MPSPFPGMDPFVEHPARWPLFRHQLVAGLYQLLLPGLVDRYRARVGGRAYTADVTLFTSVTREDHAEDYIEIRSRADNRLVTLIDVANPTNKSHPAGRAAYHGTRKLAQAERAGVVEIDLVTQGKPLLDFPRDTLADYDYAVTVTRGATPERYEVYAVPVGKRLPKFRLPLAADDRDTVVDLQVAVTRAYDHAGLSIDYAAALPPDVALSAANRAWVDTWLRQQNVR